METNNLREIKTTKGKVLTNGKAYSSVGGSVFLGVNDSVDNWYEITEEEYERIIAEENQKEVEISER